MGEAVACAHCRRPIAAHFTTCPFCKKEQPARVSKGEPIKCATCKRPYNPALDSCPFCARDQATYRDKVPAATPSHDEYKQARAAIEEDESRLRAILLWVGLGAVLSVLLAIGISAKIHAVTSSHLGIVGVVGMVGGVAAAFVGPRFVDLEGPAIGQRVTFFAGGWLASTALGYVIVATFMLMTAGPPTRVTCRVTSHGYAKRYKAARATTRYACTLPDGGSVSGSEAYTVLSLEVGRPFSIEVRRALGSWLYEPKSVLVTNTVE